MSSIIKFTTLKMGCIKYSPMTQRHTYICTTYNMYMDNYIVLSHIVSSNDTRYVYNV